MGLPYAVDLIMQIPIKCFDKQMSDFLLPAHVNWTGLACRYFSGTDTEEEYKNNLKSQPDDWYYRNHQVKYNYNKLGYRCADFGTIDWNNSIIIKGCSMVEGVGLDEPDIMSKFLSEMFDCPVINLGVGGSSILFNLINTQKLLQANIRPKLVIEIYTSLSRTMLFERKNGHILNIGPSWGKSDDEIDREYVESLRRWLVLSDSTAIQSTYYMKINSMLWKQMGIPLYVSTYFPDTAAQLKIPGLRMESDLARDLIHPGRDNTRVNAQLIFNQITNQKLI
jgi:hypothetical protein